jgi:hypothetical protein
MADGHLWRSTFQAAKETTYGTAVATATRKLYYASDSVFRQEIQSRDHHFAVGRRDNVLEITNGPQMPSGRISLPLDSAECMEVFNIAIGAPTTTTPATGTTTRLHTYKPGSSAPESGTFQWDDGANPWRMTGVYANTLGIQGSANGDNMLTSDLFAKGMTQTALAGTPTDRTPTFFQGWESKIYLETIGGTPGTTNIASTLINWNVQFNNQLGRKFTADNVNAMNKATIGELTCTAELVFEASQAISLTEYNHWFNNDVAGRLVRLEFGNNTILEAALTSFVTVDIPGKWAAFDLGQSGDGTRCYGLRLNYKYDSVLAAGFQLRAQNARAAAWV